MARVTVRSQLDADSLEALKSEDFMLRMTRRAAYRVSKNAATMQGAPRRSGKGANSIRQGPDPDDATARTVSWGRRYYYMIFHHDGWTPGGKGSGNARRPGVQFLTNAVRDTYAVF